MRSQRIAVLAPVSENGEKGGAEKFYKALTGALCTAGAQADLLEIVCNESSFEAIVDTYRKFSELDLSAYDGVISTKAPAYAVNHPNHISYLQHTMRAFYDMFETEFPTPNSQHLKQQALIHKLDKAALSYPNTRKLFVIGHEVRKRLLKYIELDSEVIHESLLEERFRCGEFGDYLFMPGRLHRWKRVDLLIEAMQYVEAPLKLKIAGMGEDGAFFMRLAESDPRIEFLGKVSDQELLDYYANALAIPFVPVREDFGLVTIEAFRSGKPVLTCTDSGEPTQFVLNGENGFVCPADPEAIAEKIDFLYNNPEEARAMGLKGMESVRGLTWPGIAQSLLSALAMDPAPSSETELKSVNPSIKTNVAVIDMQPILPAIGGGRQRLLGLYHNLGEDVDCHYVGTYDWPGEPYRKIQITDTLEELLVPLSDEHFVAAQTLSKGANGKTVIDLAFSRQCHLSTDYLEAAKKAIEDANVVVFSHPWAYPLLKEHIRENQTVVYDSHNVEAYLRAQLLDTANQVESSLLRNVVEDEYSLGRRADLILACSQEDVSRFNRVYDFAYDKMRVAPNGVMVFAHDYPSPETKHAAKTKLNLDNSDYSLIAIFIGSPYGPNLDAARFIERDLAHAMPDVTFVIVGGVGQHMVSDNRNVIITGPLDEDRKHEWFCAADIAINPIFSGSGTNIKMFDFMALGLPTVTTPTGARGIETGTEHAMLVCEPDVGSFVSAIDQLSDLELRESIGLKARRCIEEGYSWERISYQTGRLFRQLHRFSEGPRPTFSVVVPTYERHDQLSSLFERLQLQTERDFEVIVVDQSAERWGGSEQEFGFSVLYYHAPVKGLVRARNTGAMFARGEIIAFTDDDCLPHESWLLNARKYFLDRKVVGVEGLIYSDHPNDPEWRQVTNLGFAGVGFMTANLMVRSAAFQQTSGFDQKFDKPHFREDTDLGWRLLELGQVPYAEDVVIFHPAQSRKIKRESTEVHARYFENDALLVTKHPEKYCELFHKEAQWKKTPGFWENFERGFRKLGIDIPDYYIQFRERQESGATGKTGESRNKSS